MLSRTELNALQVAIVPAQDGGQVVDVLCEAFRDYPVMRFVLGTEGDYDARLHRMIGLFVSARTLLGDVMFGVRDGEELIAVVTTSNPARPAHAAFADLREAVWRELGAAANERYQKCVSAWQSMESGVPQMHVNMIGVRRVYRTLGLGTRLLQAVHALAEEIPGCRGVSLTTEDPRNVAYYQRHGYEVIGNARISSELEAWSFMRWIG